MTIREKLRRARLLVLVGVEGISFWFMWLRRLRSVKGRIGKGCMPKRGGVRLRDSRALVSLFLLGGMEDDV